MEYGAINSGFKSVFFWHALVIGLRDDTEVVAFNSGAEASEDRSIHQLQ
jgi:hypothetical protein